MHLTSTAFLHEEEIPPLFTCQGDDISPELHWKDAPEETKSFVMIMHDPDIPTRENPKRIWVHWILYDLPSHLTSLPEAIQAKDSPPVGGFHGKNDWKRNDYGGPCPPVGKHRYFFTLYALDDMLNLPAGKSRKEILEAMEGHILDQAELIGTYEKN